MDLLDLFLLTKGYLPRSKVSLWLFRFDWGQLDRGRPKLCIANVAHSG